MKKITKEFKDKSVKELENEIAKIRGEIAKTRLSIKASPAKDTNALSKMKKKLAVLLTLVSQKQ
jgi:ribosomal protein L29